MINKEINLGLYKTLLESTNAIPWKLDWATQEFIYIGPQIEVLLGWSQDSWKTSADWAERMHDEDREKTVSYCVGLSEQGIDHEADYRAPVKDGGYIWVRDVVHVIRENGVTVALIGFIFDISERKKLEEEAQRLTIELEKLSQSDQLTGLANRRLLDEVYLAEFERSKRYNRNFSILFLDIDLFKKYNDTYGHQKGDDCLRKVADSLKATMRRPLDLVARYGGEEFMIVLPETDNKVAVQLAENCRKAVYEQKIPHKKSEKHKFVTISIGVQTISSEHTAVSFIECADKLLYKAKHNGRNRVEK
ncbi:MAG: diguanylate cyclase (GGDEF)-like protein/PAS domain S-box-containing protein [Psychromonas sp.]|jgi:diguanylate cyclase (GGDEF)-like protein/PAS domain S-box-containing protein|uniref:sensor domain-containing diguanylate cyclase n=1 Tax=Psychromonas sp. TaxID=1884585 RepID=UPI0039E3FC7B